MIFILLLLSYIPALSAEVKSIPIPNGSTLNFTVNLNNVQDARATNNNTQTNPQRGNDSPLLNKLSQVWFDPQTNQNLITRLGNQTNSWISEYKWPLICCALATGYAYCCYIVASGNSFLSQKDLWSSWRQDLTLDQMLAIPQPQFAKELLQEIQRRYTDPAAVTDIVRPLGRFMGVIEEEEQQLLWYQNAFSWIEYAHLKSIIPFSTIQFAKITERLQRVTYLKNAFHTWATQYQLEQVTKMRHRALETGIPDVSQMAALMVYRYKISLLNYLAQTQAQRTPIA